MICLELYSLVSPALVLTLSCGGTLVPPPLFVESDWDGVFFVGVFAPKFLLEEGFSTGHFEDTPE